MVVAGGVEPCRMGSVNMAKLWSKIWRRVWSGSAAAPSLPASSIMDVFHS